MCSHQDLPGALVDISVLLIFFTRSDTLQKVFDRIRKARPARLFLYQDGPRENRPDDRESIARCRAIVEEIDWDCEVHRLYQEQNYGPDKSGFIADTWAFSITDKCIVLEDDVVPALSYFTFCKEMLDRYEHDERVMLISGWNYDDVTRDASSDYFFTYATYTMAWATWARVVRQWDPHYSFFEDGEVLRSMEKHMREHHIRTNSIRYWRLAKESGIPHFESILLSNQHIHKGLTIVPRCNMACNIGLGAGSAHYAAELKCMARGDRRIFTLENHELDVEHLKHPTEVKDFEPYLQRCYRIRAYGHPFIKGWRCMETLVLMCLHGKARPAFRKVLSQINNLIHRRF